MRERQLTPKSGNEHCVRWHVELESMESSTNPTDLERLAAYAPALRAVADAIVRDGQEAEDVVQEALAIAVERGAEGARDGRRWFTGVVRNLARRRVRRSEARRRWERAAARAESTESVAELVARTEVHKRLVATLLELPAPYREALLLRYFEELAPREIAARQGVPAGTVRSRLSRGLELLRGRLDQQQGGDRRAWALALLPITNTPIPCEIGALQASCATGSSGASGDMLGGLAMKITMNKTAVAVALLLLLLLGSGIAVVAMRGGDAGRVVANAELDAADVERKRARVTPDKAAQGDDGRAGDATTVEDGDAAGIGTHRVEVAVFDADGRPLSGARVEFRPTVSIFPFSGSWEQGLRRLDAPPPVLVGITDAHGHLDVMLPGKGPWAMVTRAEGHATAYRSAGYGAAPDDATRKDRPRVNEHLKRGYSIRGVVVGRDDAPLAGVDLSVDDSRSMGAPEMATRVRTATDGTFELEGVASGSAALHVGAVLVARVRVPQASPITLRLGGGVLTGTVTTAADGRPVEGAIVAATLNGGSSGIVRAYTDAMGRYTIDTVVPASIPEIRLSKEGLVDTRPSSRLAIGLPFDADGRAEMDFTMEPCAELFGVVRTATGPVVGIDVAALTPAHSFVSVRSDSEGRFVLSGLASGRVIVSADAITGGHGLSQPGLPPQWRGSFQRGDPPADWTVTLTAGERTEFDIVLVDGRASVAGSVRHGNGDPASGALVYVSGAGPATTATDGSFRLDGVRSGVNGYATARLDELRASARVAISEDGTTDNIELVLAAPKLISGRVVGADGEPVSGARVQWMDATRRPRGPAPWASSRELPTTPDGAFELSTFYVGDLLFRAIAPEHAPSAELTRRIDTESDAPDLILHLSTAPAIRGVVTIEESEPLVGARVALVGGQNRSHVRSMRASEMIVAGMTDAKGRFDIPDVAPGSWTVVVDHPSIVRFIAEVTVAESVDIVADVDRAFEIAGRIRMADGTPVTGIWVSVRRQGAQPREPGSFVSTSCDARGAFELGGLPHGTYDVQATTRSGNETSLLRIAVKDVAVGTTNLELVMRHGSEISGRVLDSDGKPVAHASVQARSESGHPHTPSDATNENGEFRITAIDPDHGPFTLRVKPPKAQRLQSCEVLGRHITTRVEGVPAGRADLEISLPLGEVIEGVVVDADGKPRPGIWLRAECVSNDKLRPGERTWSRGPGTQADASGRFRFQGLPPAEFALFVIEDPWRSPSPFGAALAGGERVTAGTTGLSLRVAETGSVSGVLIDHDGSPMAGARVAAMPSAGESISARRMAKTDVAGRFLIEGIVVDSPQDVSVSVPDRVQVRVRSVVVGGEPIRIELSLGETLRGRLVVPDGESAKQRYVKLVHESGDFETAVVTGEGGSFERKAVRPGTYRALFQTNPGRAPAEWKEIGTLRTGEDDAVLSLD